MKQIFVFSVLLFCLSTPCLAEWGKADTALLILEVIDWRQTKYATMEKFPSGEISTYDQTIYVRHEKNPILGHHPSLKKVNTYFVSCVLLNCLIARYGSERIHNFWLAIGISCEIYCITKNYSVGVKCKF